MKMRDCVRKDKTKFILKKPKTSHKKNERRWEATRYSSILSPFPSVHHRSYYLSVLQTLSTKNNLWTDCSLCKEYVFRWIITLLFFKLKYYKSSVTHTLLLLLYSLYARTHKRTSNSITLIFLYIKEGLYNNDIHFKKSLGTFL